MASFDLKQSYTNNYYNLCSYLLFLECPRGQTKDFCNHIHFLTNAVYFLVYEAIQFIILLYSTAVCSL